MENRCRICARTRKEGSDYCTYHQTGFENLQEAFKRWRQACDIEWGSFLKEVSENPETGGWAKEVAESLMKGGLS